MTDRQIIGLLQTRDDTALRELTKKHGKSCKRLAKKILGNDEDAEEIFNDALLQLWLAIPPAEPDDLGAYLHTCVKRLALNRLEHRQAKKRGGGQTAIPLDTLTPRNQPVADSIEQLMDERLLDEAIHRFLAKLPKETVTIFVHYYGNDRSSREIAEAFHISQSKVTVTLMRTRRKLRKYLEEEGLL